MRRSSSSGALYSSFLQALQAAKAVWESMLAKLT